MKTKFLFIIGLLSAICQMIAQETRDHDPFYVYESTPSSPEAATLGQYGQINASPYNGKANIFCDV